MMPFHFNLKINCQFTVHIYICRKNKQMRQLDGKAYVEKNSFRIKLLS